MSLTPPVESEEESDIINIKYYKTHECEELTKFTLCRLKVLILNVNQNSKLVYLSLIKF
jgi:hypothetical protein